MKDYKGLPLKVGDKALLIHRIRGENNMDGKKHVVMVTIMGEEERVIYGWRCVIDYHSTLYGPAPAPRKNQEKYALDNGTMSLGLYCEFASLMKVPDDIVDNPKAILAHVRMQGFEYE